MPTAAARQSRFQLALLRLISGGLAIGFILAGVLGTFEPEWMRYTALVAGVLSVIFTAALIWIRREFDHIVRVTLALLMATVFVLGLTIQPATIGALTGLVFLGIAVGIASYERLTVALVMSAASVGFGAVSIALLRSSIAGPAVVVYGAVAATSLFAVFGFRGVAARAEADAVAESLKDPLTDITNRRGLDLGASLLSAIADRSGQRLGCLMLDLDNFKAVNDEHGHEAGDRVLIAVARRIQELARQGDLFVRLGGEEFVVFTVVKSHKELKLIGERLRAAVEQLEVDPPVTTSVGGALHSAGAVLRLDDLMSRADRQLYLAKDSGRNTLRIAPD